MGLIDDLGGGPIGLDTPVFIYFMEEHPVYLPLVQSVFAAVDQRRPSAVTSGVTLLEVLVIPYREGNGRLAERYEALLVNSRGLKMVDLDRPLLRSAAQLRALYRLRTPDALQLAAAMAEGCSAFLTNDRVLPSLPGMRTLQLRDYIQARRGRSSS